MAGWLIEDLSIFSLPYALDRGLNFSWALELNYSKYFPQKAVIKIAVVSKTVGRSRAEERVCYLHPLYVWSLASQVSGPHDRPHHW